MNSQTKAPIEIRLPELPDESRAWIYMCDRKLEDTETQALEKSAREFAQEWTAHRQQLRAEAVVYAHRFLCLFVDQSAAGASGCSIDSSVRFVQAMEKQFTCSFTNRMLLAYITEDGQIASTDVRELPQILSEGKIARDTLIFDNLIANLGDMRKHWIRPLSDSWCARFLP